ncbi:MAG: HNH endonuclease [Verrucomicrobiota bacterium]|mgnify:CR=1 FL=1
MVNKYGTLWTREEQVLALYLYCQIPFKKTKANNPEVIKLAHLLGRTPASVARKLGNFGAFDPRLAAQGISGLAHGSKGDETIWHEYSHHWEKLVSDSQKLLESLHAKPANPEKEEIIAIKIPDGKTEKRTIVVQRVYQDFFRRSVLSSHNNRCCISAVEIPELLIAGHIIPWAESEEHRLNPENGLALCVLFDKAFDRGLMTIDEQLKVVYSKRVKKLANDFIKSSLLEYEGRKICLPNRFCPRPEFLQWHRDNIFTD